MNGLKVMLFGIAVICFSGFIVVGQAVGFPFNRPLYWGMLLGLAISFVGLLMDDSDENEEDDTTADESDEPDDTDSDEDPESADSTQQNYYSASRFPPM